MSAVPNYTKGQINSLPLGPLKEALEALGLPFNGGKIAGRASLKAALYPPQVGIVGTGALGSAKYVSASQPNPSPASTSVGTAELGSASQPFLSPEPTVQTEGREQWHHFNQTRGPVYARIPAASRNKASQVLSTVLLKTYTVGGKPEWDKLYGFARVGLGSSKRGGKKHT